MWVTRQKMNYATHIEKCKQIMKENKDIHALWTDFIQDNEYIEYFRSNEEIWKEKLKNVKDYIKNNHKLPSNTDKNKDIKSLGMWVTRQKMNYATHIEKCKEIMKNKDIHALWTDFIQDDEYKKYLISNEEIWKEKLKNVKDYIKNNQKLPNKRDKDEDIKSLGSWLGTQKMNYATHIEKCKNIMKENKDIHTLWTDFIQDNEYIEYFRSNEEIWKEKLKNVKDYIKNNHKLPSNTDKNKDIKSLGMWVTRQKMNYATHIEKCKEIMKNKDIHALWTDFIQDDKYKEYFVPNEEIWKEKLKNVKDYINENQQLPKNRDKNEDIKSLGEWVHTQKRNYTTHIEKCKNIMKDKDIHALWTDFIQNDEYNIHFNKKSIKKSMILPKSSLKKDESNEEKRLRISSEISILHQKYKSMNSKNLHKEFHENPELWTKYHEISEENEKSFPEEEIPRNQIIQKLDKMKTKRPYSIFDLGCGKAHIYEHFKDDKRFIFKNYDHISSNDNINVCDISKLPDEDYSADICILSLALWGSNCIDYIKEVKRILPSRGILLIIEPTKRWSNKDEQNNIIQGSEASKLKDILKENDFQILEENIQKFSYFECSKK